jgi:hypothetical protein
MNQVISYSLYGKDLRFMVGAIKNAQLAQMFFPDFTVRYYVGASVPTWVRSTLDLFMDVEQVEVDMPENHLSKLWRFQAILDPEVDVVLSRDVDARLGLREAYAHKQFLESDFGFHIIRDHPTGHNWFISAGMFAVKTAKAGVFFEEMMTTPFSDIYTQDQVFLTEKIYPHIAGDCLIHDSYYSMQVTEPSKQRHIKYPKVNELCHIGAALDENDVYIYKSDQELSLELSGHVKYIYDWGKDEDTNNG